MDQAPRYHAGLVFLGTRDISVPELRRTIETVFADFGQDTDPMAHGTDSQNLIVGHALAADVQAELAPPPTDMQRRIAELDDLADINQSVTARAARAALRIQVTLYKHNAEEELPMDLPETILARILLQMVQRYNADYVEWLNRHAVLTADEFMNACSHVKPKRVRSVRPKAPVASAATAERFPSVEETQSRLTARMRHLMPGAKASAEEDLLANVFRSEPSGDDLAGIEDVEEVPSNTLRLATWAMTGTVAFLSLPVAATLGVISLAKGEDFRLNTQALSLTGLAVVLTGTGAVADVVAVLPLP